MRHRDLAAESDRLKNLTEEYHVEWDRRTAHGYDRAALASYARYAETHRKWLAAVKAEVEEALSVAPPARAESTEGA